MHNKAMSRPYNRDLDGTPVLVWIRNHENVFQLTDSTGQMKYNPRRILVDSGSSELVLARAGALALGITEVDMEPLPYSLHVASGNSSLWTPKRTRDDIVICLQSDRPEYTSTIRLKAIVSDVEHYDVLVGGVVLYPMGFVIDFWKRTVSYQPGWQSTGDDRRDAELPVCFGSNAMAQEKDDDKLHTLV